MREARYGDFAIILRSPSGKAATYVNTLNNSGIPAYSENKSSFFDAIEIKIMLNLLRVIDNPGIDIPLLSVLCVVKAENLRFTLLSANMRKQTIRQENLLMNLKFCVIVPVQIPLTLSFQKRVK